MNATIAALATPPGRSAVAVIRLSGPGSREALWGLRVTPGPPRQACLRALRDRDGGVFDRALVLWFPAPQSYTGEDCAELHVHGSRFVVQAALERLLETGARLAEPGEFTRRAFEHGKLDLAQAEAVADLVDAETQAQSRQAIGQLGGALSARHESWRARLTDIQARLEAAVDFPDEGLEPDLAAASAALAGLARDIAAAAGDGVRAEAVRDGWRVAIIGAPNAGKSTLLNLLAGRAAAIVTEVAGTTRDVIEAPIDLAGYRVLLADMAGLRETQDPIEAEGVRRAIAWAGGAERRVWVVDGAGDGSWRACVDLVRPGDLCLINKGDSGEGSAGVEAAAHAEQRGLALVRLSLVCGAAEPVREWLRLAVIADLGGAEFPAATNARHREALSEAADQIRRALASLGRPELASEDVRLAVRALRRITGAIGSEDVLDRVFSTFCIGK
jgi:tRNA modification GTPase